MAAGHSSVLLCLQNSEIVAEAAVTVVQLDEDYKPTRIDKGLQEALLAVSQD